MHEMKLFVTGASPTSIKAIENLTRMANVVLRGGYRLEVIDVLAQPHEASTHGVFCTPMLVKTNPQPEAWVLGELTDEARLLRVLEPNDAATTLNRMTLGGKPVPVLGLTDAASEPNTAPEHLPGASLAHPSRIVVIDDYEGIHDSFRVALNGAYVDLISAYTGELGVETVRAAKPNLVYLDLKMPGKDGVETLRDIRTHDDHTPVIIMTAFAEEFTDRLRRADRDGAHFELLAKPLDIDQLHLVSAVATGGFGPAFA